jgi:SprT protein
VNAKKAKVTPKGILAATKRVYEVLEQARELYDLDIDIDQAPVKVLFNLRGKAAAQARCRRHRGDHKVRDLQVRINPEAYALDPDDMLGDTIPHEVAHLVCFLRPSLGRNHDAGWVSVARSLGCSGERTHSMELTPTRRKKVFIYELPSGIHVELGQGRHSKTQKYGTSYRHVDTGEYIHPEAFKRWHYA